MFRFWLTVGASVVLAIAATACSGAGAGVQPTASVAPTAAALTPAPAQTPKPAATPHAAASPATPALTPTPTASTLPTASAAEVVLVLATDACTITTQTQEHNEGQLLYHEHFRCQRTANDSRVSGQLDFDVMTTFESDTASAAYWTAETYTLKNDAGRWDGSARGAVAVWPDVGLINYGKVVYQGSGAYEGLTFTEIFAVGDEGGTVLGMIEHE